MVLLLYKIGKVAILVTAPDGTTLTFSATVTARDPSHELAILTLSAPTLTPIPIARSSSARIGQDLYLVGSTEAGGRRFTKGVLSAKGRKVPVSNGQTVGGFLQTDVDLERCSLGGALVDSGGRLVGVPVASFQPPGSPVNAGVNFALGSDVLLQVVPNLIAYGNATGRR